MNSEIKYIGFYDVLGSKHKRNSCLSAVNKMNYIMGAITKARKKIKLISPAWYIYGDAPITGEKITYINENISVIQAPSFPTRTKVSTRLKYHFSQIWLFLYLIRNTTKNEEIIAYHSLALMTPLYWAKKIKKFKLIYEVEEIYTDVINLGKIKRRKEFKMISIADKYIFPTELLDEKLNVQNKPNIIIHGTYEIEDDRNLKFNDDKTHVVYAGTFDPRKGGAATAAAAAKYLDEKYHIHIIGFGSEYEKEQLKKLIENVSKTTKCTVSYDGLYTGDDYIKFIQKCDIGLSTQTPNAKYNDTSFPSKVLSYMGNGLRVVSIKIKVLENSKISNLLYYYDKDSPSEVAKAIKRVDLSSSYNSRKIIADLDFKFIKDIRELLEN